METLTPEGKAIFDTLSSAAAAQQEQQRKELHDLIAQAVTSVVDSAVRSSIESVWCLPLVLPGVLLLAIRESS
jgi:hypothetical protein